MLTTKYCAVFALAVAFATICYAEILASTTHNQVASNLLQRPNKIYAPGQVRCGDWQNEETGSIYYKPFETVMSNERCVWVIGVPKALGYAFSLQYLGHPTNQPDSGQQLIISGVKHNLTAEPIFKAEIPTATGFFNVTDSHIVIVSFHSESLNDTRSRTGFVLLYETIFQVDPEEELVITPISLLSTHQILSSPVFDFKYPVSAATTYAANELAAFIFPPSNSVYGCSNNYISYRGSLTCPHGLHAYHFNLSDTEAVGHWQYQQMLCGVTTWNHLNDDLVLMFLTSDTTAGPMFWLNYLGC